MTDSDDAPLDDGEGPDDVTLLDAVTTAGAAIDKAQVLGDVAAHRIVQVVAQAADGRPPFINDIVGPPAVESERIASGVADAAARYERARARHVVDFDDLERAPEPEVLDEFGAVIADSARAEADAAALLDRIDDAQRRLERRAATSTTATADPGQARTSTDPGSSAPHLH
jgi:hypothetical protein